MKVWKFSFKYLVFYFGSLFLLSLFLGGCFGGGGKGPKLSDSNPKQVLFEYTLLLNNQEVYDVLPQLNSFINKTERMVTTTVNLDTKGRFQLLKGIALTRKAFLWQFSTKNKSKVLDICDVAISDLHSFYENANSSDDKEILYTYWLGRVERLKGSLKGDKKDLEKSIFAFKKLYYLLSSKEKNYSFGRVEINRFTASLELVKSYLKMGLYDLAEDLLQRATVDKYLDHPLYLETLADLRLAQRKENIAIRVLENFLHDKYAEYYNRSYNLYRLLGMYNLKILKREKNYAYNRELVLKKFLKDDYFVSKEVEEFHGIYLYKTREKEYQKLWQSYKIDSKNVSTKKSDPLVAFLATYLKRYELADSENIRKRYQLQPLTEEVVLWWEEKEKENINLLFYLKELGKNYVIKFQDKAIGFLDSNNMNLSSLKISISKLLGDKQTDELSLKVEAKDSGKTFDIVIPVLE